MSRKIYDLVAPIGTYTDHKTGEEKTRWMNCGAVIEKDNGQVSAKIEGLPIDFNGWLTCSVPKPRDSQAPARQGKREAAKQPHPDDPDDDLPF